jgi:3-hydroxyisobutyrate dehydrogenase
MAREVVGFIGLGTMGQPMAANLLGRGFPLVVYDVNPKAMETLEGAEPMGSPRDVGAAARFVVTSLPGPRQVEEVLGAVIEGMAPGGTLIDMSSIDPGTTRRVGERAAARGLKMIDAPVSGAPPKARDGTLTIMVGGDPQVLDECRPILEALGENIFHVGPLGTGEAVKLVNNLLAASHAAAVGEAFNIGVRFGLSPRVMYDVISTSSGDCWPLRTRVPYPEVLAASPANEEFAPGFMTDLMHKDVGLALALARDVGAPTPLGELIERLYGDTSAQGYGRQDFSAVARLYQEGKLPS